MQVRDLTERGWVPVPVICRSVPTVVPIIYCRDGKWGAEPALVRCTKEVVMVFPVSRKRDDSASAR